MNRLKTPAVARDGAGTDRGASPGGQAAPGEADGPGFAGLFSLRICGITAGPRAGDGPMDERRRREAGATGPRGAEARADGRRPASQPSPMKPLDITLDGSTGTMLVTPITEREWWSMTEEERSRLYPRCHYYRPLRIYFAIDFRADGPT